MNRMKVCDNERSWETEERVCWEWPLNYRSWTLLWQRLMSLWNTPGVKALIEIAQLMRFCASLRAISSWPWASDASCSGVEIYGCNLISINRLPILMTLVLLVLINFPTITPLMKKNLYNKCAELVNGQFSSIRSWLIHWTQLFISLFLSLYLFSIPPQPSLGSPK